MPNSVIIGRLRSVDLGSFVIGGGFRIMLAPGIKLPTVPLGTSLTITAVSRDGITYAEKVERSPEGGMFTGAY
jgi:hypothetical protein